ncbi:MAG TPA: response regulator transcription factor [Gaiellaceae bacterium]|nr:response regulator transcription factor [Gaiellaceae bacterium]
MRGHVRSVGPVLVVSDTRLVRDGVVEMLRRGNVDAAGSGIATAAADVASARVAIADMSNAASASAVCALIRTLPLPVLAFGVPAVEEVVFVLAEAGVAGFVDGDAALDDLVAAVARAQSGEASCPPSLVTMLLRRIVMLADHSTVSPHAALTARERQIVQLIAEGLSNKEIARRLCIEVATVKNHVHNILDKLQVNRRTEAVARLRLAPPLEIGASRQRT